MNETVPAVKFVPYVHKEKPVIRIDFDYNAELIKRVKALPGAAWSQTMKCWYVPDTEAYRARFKMEVKVAQREVLDTLCGENVKALSYFIKELQLKGYSRSTIVTYKNEFCQLLQTLGNKPVQTLSRDRLRDYFVWCLTVKKLSENTLHSRLNAVIE